MLPGLLGLPGLALISLGASFLLQKGRIVLKSGQLIEHKILNYPRALSYSHIFEVKQGPRADRTWIRYYC